MLEAVVDVTNEKCGALLVADDPGSMAVPASILAAHNVSVSHARTWDRAPAAARVVVLQRSRPSESDLEMLRAVAEYRVPGLSGAIAAVPFDMLDMATALCGRQVAILCEPRAADWQIAIGEMLGGTGHLHDASRDDPRVRLQRLMHEMADIAEDLPAPRGPRPRAMNGRAIVAANDIRDIIRARRMRERVFTSGLLIDPGWDLLLELFAAHLEQRKVTASDACIASGAPASTALRWIGVLEQNGLVERQPDSVDRRRIFIRLSELGVENMCEYVAQVARLNLPLV